MRLLQAIFAVSSLAWGFGLYIGVRLYLGVVAQDVAGYPNTGQLCLFVLLPCVLLATNVALTSLTMKLHLELLMAAFVVELFLLMFYFMSLGGGI
jgi:hypothetical protein